MYSIVFMKNLLRINTVEGIYIIQKCGIFTGFFFRLNFMRSSADTQLNIFFSMHKLKLKNITPYKTKINKFLCIIIKNFF